jgi:hypothetical protein
MAFLSLDQVVIGWKAAFIYFEEIFMFNKNFAYLLSPAENFVHIYPLGEFWCRYEYRHIIFDPMLKLRQNMLIVKARRTSKLLIFTFLHHFRVAIIFGILEQRLGKQFMHFQTFLTRINTVDLCYVSFTRLLEERVNNKVVSDACKVKNFMWPFRTGWD